MNELISSSNNQYLNKYSNNLNKNKKQTIINKNKVNNNAISSQNRSIGNQTILAKRGQAGYLKEMDLDEDGKISLEEFNEYCENNGISSKDKITMVTAMLAANTNSKLAKDTIKNKEDKNDNNNDNAVYAKEGDDKYDEAMDENSNGIVTYTEYLKYINQKDKNEDRNKEDIKDSQEENQTLKNDKISETYNSPSEIEPIFEFEV